jgi:hypothetical protein
MRSFVTCTLRWTGRVARTGRRGMHIRFWWESQKERDD